MQHTNLQNEPEMSSSPTHRARIHPLYLPFDKVDDIGSSIHHSNSSYYVSGLQNTQDPPPNPKPTITDTFSNKYITILDHNLPPDSPELTKYHESPNPQPPNPTPSRPLAKEPSQATPQPIVAPAASNLELQLPARPLRSRAPTTPPPITTSSNTSGAPTFYKTMKEEMNGVVGVQRRYLSALVDQNEPSSTGNPAAQQMGNAPAHATTASRRTQTVSGVTRPCMSVASPSALSKLKMSLTSTTTQNTNSNTKTNASGINFTKHTNNSTNNVASSNAGRVTRTTAPVTVTGMPIPPPKRRTVLKRTISCAPTSPTRVVRVDHPDSNKKENGPPPMGKERPFSSLPNSTPNSMNLKRAQTMEEASNDSKNGPQTDHRKRPVLKRAFSVQPTSPRAPPPASSGRLPNLQHEQPPSPRQSLSSVQNKPITTTSVQNKPITTTSVQNKPITTSVQNKPTTTTSVQGKSMTTNPQPFKPPSAPSFLPKITTNTNSSQSKSPTTTNPQLNAPATAWPTTTIPQMDPSSTTTFSSSSFSSAKNGSLKTLHASLNEHGTATGEEKTEELSPRTLRMNAEQSLLSKNVPYIPKPQHAPPEAPKKVRPHSIATRPFLASSSSQYQPSDFSKNYLAELESKWDEQAEAN